MKSFSTSDKKKTCRKNDQQGCSSQTTCTFNQTKGNKKQDSRVDLQNLNHINARTSVDLRFNWFIFFNLL